MARWKLMTAHYINVPGTEWEYTENDRKTNRPKRVKFQVPTLLDPADPGSWTNRWGSQGNEEGEIIVCHDGKGEPNDTIFTGDPTPDMIPMDPEAVAISASFADKWRYKPEDSGASFSQSLVDKFQSDIATTQSKQADGIEKLVSSLEALVAQNQKILETTLVRRV